MNSKSAVSQKGYAARSQEGIIPSTPGFAREALVARPTLWAGQESVSAVTLAALATTPWALSVAPRRVGDVLSGAGAVPHRAHAVTTGRPDDLLDVVVAPIMTIGA